MANQPAIAQPAPQPKKKAKDPSLPKKPMTPFFTFLQMRRKEMKQANPDIAVTEITRQAGQEWNAMTLEQRMVYKRIATPLNPGI